MLRFSAPLEEKHVLASPAAEEFLGVLWLITAARSRGDKAVTEEGDGVKRGDEMGPTRWFEPQFESITNQTV